MHLYSNDRAVVMLLLRLIVLFLNIVIGDVCAEVTGQFWRLTRLWLDYESSELATLVVLSLSTIDL